MAYSAVPSTVFGAGYAASANTIVLNTNDNAGTKLLTELTDAEAHATTGDWRKIIFAIMEMIYTKWNAVASGDRPTKLTVAKSTTTNVATGVVTNTYTIRAYTSVSAQEVNAEA